MFFLRILPTHDGDKAQEGALEQFATNQAWEGGKFYTSKKEFNREF